MEAETNGLDQEEKKVDSEEVCRKYRKISRFRPPFSYNAPTARYSEVDESRLFELEEKVFDLGRYPTPPNDPVFQGAYKALATRHAALAGTIDRIKSYDALHEESTPIMEGIGKTRIEIGVVGAPPQDPVQKKQLFELEKKEWEKHYKEKKLFFHQALSYLYLIESHHPEEKERKENKRFRQEAYAMFIGHQATTYSRSASHELGPVRRDKQPTIKHPYAVAVHGTNFWLEKIEKALSDEEVDLYFEELNLELIRDLFHDTQEDYFITEDDLVPKIIEMLNFDFRISTRFRRAGERLRKKDGKPGTPKNINVAWKHHELIAKELWALTEEEEDKDADPSKSYYLARKLPEIPKGRQAVVYLSKVRDRMNNLQTPRYKTPGKTLVKLRETLKIADIGIQLLNGISEETTANSPITKTDLIKEISGLVRVCLKELKNYEETDEFQKLAEGNSGWQLELAQTRESFTLLEAALQLAA